MAKTGKPSGLHRTGGEKIRGKTTCTVMSGRETGETAETGTCEGKTDI